MWVPRAVTAMPHHPAAEDGERLRGEGGGWLNLTAEQLEVAQRALGHRLVLRAFGQPRAIPGRHVRKGDVGRLVVVGVTPEVGEDAAERGGWRGQDRLLTAQS